VPAKYFKSMLQLWFLIVYSDVKRAVLINIAAVRGFITKRLHLTGTLAIAVLLLRRRVANYLPTNKNYE